MESRSRNKVPLHHTRGDSSVVLLVDLSEWFYSIGGQVRPTRCTSYVSAAVSILLCCVEGRSDWLSLMFN